MLKTLLNLFRPTPETGQVRVIEPAEIRNWHEAGTAVIVDVREPHEVAVEAIPGAVNLPLSSFDPSRVPVPAEGRHLVLHCQAGIRCAPASAKLVEAGWTGEIVRMKGGLNAWKAAGGPVRRG